MHHRFHRRTLGALLLALAFGAAPLARAADAITLTHVHGLAFSADGRHGTRAGLARLALDGAATPQPVPLPPMADDAVAYIAQNPARPDQIAVETFRRAVLVSDDGGRQGSAAADDGVTR